MNLVKPYGDTLNDGAMQLSFTLPIPFGGKAKECAKKYLEKLGFKDINIVNMSYLSDEFTFFIAYVKSDLAIDYDSVEYISAIEKSMSMDEINNFIKEYIKRKVVVIGAATGTDAHTVGIDAIMNMKGYNHHYGLERYPMIEAMNMGSQVPNEKLIEMAVKINADAILVSQVVTQKDIHIKNLTNFIELVEAEGLRDRFILIVGGPRIDNKLAIELGFDAGFGPGTYAEDVATFIVKKMVERKRKLG
ncbi:MAG: cobalamin-dependent protein [Elusimicrobiales bacterium]|nr:cobalamin-dependent protein [Elusimicrobiales bacterium]